MKNDIQRNLDLLIAHGHSDLLKVLGHGIEKEALRITSQGDIAQTDHPKALGSTLTHSQITTDYSEALLEFITGVHQNAQDALTELTELHQFTYQMLNNESLWCASMPCFIKSPAKIRIAEYGSSNIGQMKHIYRVGLEHRYGKMMQTIAGIHYNFSLPKRFWPIWKTLNGSTLSDQDFASDQYFKLIRNFRRYSWLLLYLFGASPAVGKDFLQGRDVGLQPLNDTTEYLPYATSLRMSDLGYTSQAQKSLSVCFNQLNTYADSLQCAIKQPYPDYEKIGVKVDGKYRQLNTHILQIENEYYSDIRPKRVTESGEKPVHALMRRGIEYIEVRNLDINPLLPLGIDLQQAQFIDAFLLACLFGNDDALSEKECAMIARNKEAIIKQGRKPDLILETPQGTLTREQFAHNILDQVNSVAQHLDQLHNTQQYTQAVEQQRKLVNSPNLTPSGTIIKTLTDNPQGFQHWGLAQSKQHQAALNPASLNPKTASLLHQAAKASLVKQTEIEQGDQQSFDAFLAAYQQ